MLLSNVLLVDASGITETHTGNKTWSWNVNKSITPDDYNTSIPYFVYMDEHQGHEELDCEWWFWNYSFAPFQLFTTVSSAYAYRIEIGNPSNYTNKCQADWIRPIVGTTSEIAKGEGVYGKELGSNMTQSIWYFNDNAVKDVYISFMGHFSTFYMEDFVAQDIKTTGSVRIDVYRYTKEQFDTLVSDAIESGNGLQAEGNELAGIGNALQTQGNTLMEEQNNLQKEQNETSAGILASINDFFGGFFDNLVSSVIGIFVPTKEELLAYLTAEVEWMQEAIGIIGLPLIILSEVAKVFLSPAGKATITFPGFEWQGHVVWREQIINLASPLDGGRIMVEVFQHVRFVTSILIVFAFIDYLRKVLERDILGGQD